MNKIQLRTTFFGIVFLVMILLNGCLMKSTPPGPNTAYGSVEGVSYTFHKWGEGLSVMIWHDLNGEGSCTGSGSTSDPVYREYCTVESTDGRTLEWQIHTTDGVAAEMRINGNEYKLADGVLFFIDHQDSTTHVVQLQRDLSTLATNHESVTAFAPTDQEVSTFVKIVKESRLSDTFQVLWESQSIENYRYTLQVGCSCLVDVTKPVTIEIVDGQVASITYVEDGSNANPQLFEQFNNIDKLFTIINDADSQDPARFYVTYDPTFGVPLSVDIDISEMIADEELYLTVSNFETLP